jgi:signal transduction histidine kinase
MTDFQLTKHRIIFLFFLLVGGVQMKAADVKEVSHEAFVFIDSTNALTIDELGHMQFIPLTNHNFGFNVHRAWLKLPLNDSIKYHDYLQVGKYNTFPITLYGIDSAGSWEVIQKMSFKRRDVYKTQAFRKYEYLIVKTEELNVPTLLPIRLLADTSIVLSIDSDENFIFFISTILMLLIAIGSLSSFFVTKQYFYLVYFFQLIFILGWVAYDSGYTKLFLSNTGIIWWVNISLAMIFFICLPLILMLKVINYHSELWWFLKVLLGFIVFQFIMVLIGFDLVRMITVEVSIAMISLIFLTLYFRQTIHGSNKQLFTAAYLLVLIIPIGKPLLLLGVLPDSFFTRMSYEFGLMLESILWGIYIVLNNIEEFRSRIELETNLTILEKKSKYSLIEGQESERNWFGKELHDNIGSTLSAVRLLIQTDPKSTDKYLKSINEELIQLSSRYQNPLEDNESLEKSIQRYIGVINQSDSVAVSLEYNTHAADQLPPQDKLNIYRVIQELLTNAIRHGEATKLALQVLKAEKDHLIIYVEDNGKGFPEDYKEGVGFTNIRTRLQHRLIDFSVSSKPGVGAQVQLIIQL